MTRTPGRRRPTGARARRADPARRVAFDVLQEVSLRDAYSNLALPRAIAAARLDTRDAAFATELTYGTLRWRGSYDAVIGACSDRPPGELDSAVLDVLRLGGHQLFSMHVPTHAAVDTAVDLTAAVSGRRPTGFVNAVLRKMSRRTLAEWLAELAPDETLHSWSIRYSHPQWVIEQLRAAVGDDDGTKLLLAADNEVPAISLVARPGLASVDDLVRSGAQPGRWAPTAATWPGGDPGGLAAVRSGAAGVQDEGSQLVALALAAVPVRGPDHSWLDLCAGPGGKAALLGAIAQQRDARVTAVESREHRAELVRAVVPANVDVVTADGTDVRWATGQYDRVLVDVPCSGLGALRRRPEARWRKRPADITALRPLQEALLQRALTAVRPGGVVAYVTCSPVLDETSGVVDAVLGGREGVEVLDARSFLPRMPDLGAGPDVQLWPHCHGTDAMYLAMVRRE